MSAELTKQQIKCRVDAFVTYVQDVEQHRFFSPGLKWWAVSLSSKLNSILPNCITFLEQNDITASEMEKAFGKYWKAQIENHFPRLQSRCYLGNCLFLSPRDIIEFDSNQTPSRDNIVVRSEYSTSNRSWMKLQFDISRAVPRGSTIESNFAATPKTITTTTTTTTTTITSNTTSKTTTTTVMVSDSAKFAITTSCNASPGGNCNVIAV